MFSVQTFNLDFKAIIPCNIYVSGVMIIFYMYINTFHLVSQSLPINITAFFPDVPQTSIKWTASPHLSDGWPVNTTHGVWYTLPRSPANRNKYNYIW